MPVGKTIRRRLIAGAALLAIGGVVMLLVLLGREQTVLAERVALLQRLDRLVDALDLLGYEVVATALGEEDPAALATWRLHHARFEEALDDAAQRPGIDPAVLRRVSDRVADMQRIFDHRAPDSTVRNWLALYRSSHRAATAEVTVAERHVRSDLGHIGQHLARQRAGLGVLLVLLGGGAWLTRRARPEPPLAAEPEPLSAHAIQAHKLQAVGQLASGTAHDFNNLLTVITGGIEDIDGHLPPDHAARDGLRLIQQAAEQAADVTHALLTFSRGGASGVREPVCLQEVVAAANRLLDRVIPAHITRLTQVATPLLWVHGDATQLTQVILNLALNARDAMPSGGTLQLLLEPASLAGQPAAALHMTDSGTGLTPELRQRALEPFFTTKPRGRGTGLGLAIVHGIVTDHGGQIQWTTGLDRGTGILVLLPCLPAESMEQAAGLAPGHTILLAGGEDYVTRTLVSGLRLHGFEVVACAEVTAALTALVQQGPRLAAIVCGDGVQLPDGTALAIALARQAPHCPMVLLTSSEAPARDGMVILRTPFTIDALIAAVQRAAAGRAQRASRSE